MPGDEMKRIGIFQYEWPVKIYTVDLVAKLAESGFQTDLYLYACDTSLCSPSVLARYPNVRVFGSTRSLAARIVTRIIRNARKLLGLPYQCPQREAGGLKRTLKSMGTYKYDYFIGIEKNGLIWAGILSEKLGVPIFYYSLELYIEGHPALDFNSNSAFLRQDEKKYHARAVGTIIQDALRAKTLFESNGVKEKNAIYIPVSVSGGKVKEKSHFLHERLGLEFHKKIILYIGMVCKNRGVNELIQCASRLGEDFVMVFHGPFYPDVSTEGNFGGKVFFSRDMINNEEIPKIISSAYIGVAFYGDKNANDRLTAFSSEKIAYYMQSGLPIISHRNESYELLMQQHRCGELIAHINQLPEAAQKIDVDYASYRENAFAAFEHYYSFDINVRALTGYLSRH
jgi:glycosyltransferase involved in cell wall biosynthesis